MKVQSTADRPLLLFISAPEDGGGGAYRVDPGEIFDVPDGTALPAGVVPVGAPDVASAGRSAGDAPADPAAGKGDA